MIAKLLHIHVLYLLIYTLLSYLSIYYLASLNMVCMCFAATEYGTCVQQEWVYVPPKSKKWTTSTFTSQHLHMTSCKYTLYFCVAEFCSHARNNESIIIVYSENVVLTLLLATTDTAVKCHWVLTRVQSTQSWFDLALHLGAQIVIHTHKNGQNGFPSTESFPAKKSGCYGWQP